MASVRTQTGTASAALDPHRLRRRALIVVAGLVVLGLIAALAPGLGEVRDRFANARPGWIALAVAFEVASALSYVLMFRPIFCARMSRRRSAELALAEVGTGSIIPASGIGGLALGAWVLSEHGMPADVIARRSVAFFLIKASVNFVAVAVVGFAMFAGLGPHQPASLTLLPAVLGLVAPLLVVALPLIGRGDGPAPGSGRVRRGLAAARRALVDGVREAGSVVARRNPAVLIGAIGYWLWDNAVLWATFHAFGQVPHFTVVLMAYLLGQMGGLLPLPGGLGGIDGGLIGAFLLYGAPAATAAAAVLSYRVILFWAPLLIGMPAFAALRRSA